MRSPLFATVLLLLTSMAAADDDRPDRKVDDPKLQKAINKAVDAGVAHLQRAQTGAGCWDYDGESGLPGQRAGRNPDATGGLTALALYALAASGVPSGDPAVRKGVAWVEQNAKPFGPGAAFGTYSVSLLVLALTRIDARVHRKRIHGLADLLVASQLENDLWNYRVVERRARAGGGKKTPAAPPAALSEKGDHSNAQFAVLALWAAQERAGFKVPKVTWRRVHESLQRSQLEDGRWGYRPASGRGAGIATRGRAGMTAAGLVSYVYALAGAKGGAKYLPGARKSPVAERGLKSFVREPRVDWGDYYLVYAVERVGTVLARPSKDWYDAGARALIASQGKDGSWPAAPAHGDSGRVYETALALLFLSRATDATITPRSR